MSLPYFSVVIPAYNASRFIGETLTSVLEQTFSDYEIIIVNDGSTDDTRRIIENTGDSRIRLYNIPNGGVSHARNYGISKARGKYVAFLDADDIWHSHHLESANKAFVNCPDIPWYASRYEIHTARPIDWSIKTETNAAITKYFDAACLYVHSSTVIIKRSILNNFPQLFPETVHNAEDWIAWAKIASSEPHILFCNIPTVIYRDAPDSATKQDEEILHKYLAVSHHFQRLHNTTSEFRRYCRWRARERWQIILSKYSTRRWIPFLKLYRSELGWPTYFLLYLFSLAFHMIGLFLGKYFSILSNYNEWQRRRNILS